jgi:hypothetical protein
MDDKLHILKDFFHVIWQQGRTSELDKFFADTAEHKGVMPGFTLSVDELHIFVAQIRALVSDIVFDVAHSMSQGHWLSAIFIVRAKSVSTGGLIEVPGQTFVRFEGDRIAEMYHAFDFLTFFQQVGQLPEDSHVVLMAGTKLS